MADLLPGLAFLATDSLYPAGVAQEQAKEYDKCRLDTVFPDDAQLSY
jgi:hypothetical protein